MSDDPFGREQKPGLLSRLLGRSGERRPIVTRVTKTTRTDRLALTVPAARAAEVRDAVEAWLSSRGVTATLAIEDVGDGKCKLSAKFADDENRVDLSDDAVQSELQDVVRRALPTSD
jgi:hypothetical protein